MTATPPAAVRLRRRRPRPPRAAGVRMNSARVRTLGSRDVIVASVMAAPGVSGGWQIVRQATGELRGERDRFVAARSSRLPFPAAEHRGRAPQQPPNPAVVVERGGPPRRAQGVLLAPHQGCLLVPHLVPRPCKLTDPCVESRRRGGTRPLLGIPWPIAQKMAVAGLVIRRERVMVRSPAGRSPSRCSGICPPHRPGRWNTPRTPAPSGPPNAPSRR